MAFLKVPRYVNSSLQTTAYSSTSGKSGHDSPRYVKNYDERLLISQIVVAFSQRFYNGRQHTGFLRRSIHSMAFARDRPYVTSEKIA